jgi:putative DNA primase/helicase
MNTEFATDWKDAPEVNEESKEISMLEAIRLSTKSACGIAELGLPPRAALLGDWFKEGDTGFLYAPRGLGKTWLSMLIACSIANGGQAGPWPANGAHKVVYIDGEMAVDGMLERLVGMQATENLAVLNHEILFHLGNKTLNLADHSTQSAITTYLQEVGARLVVLDNLSCLCSGMEENKGDDWERILHWLLTLRRLKIAVLIVHHAGRNGQMRGTSRREDAAFWVLKLEYAENEKSGQGRMAQFVSVFTKERNSGREQVPLEWTFETDSSGVVRITYKQADPLAVFRSWVECGYNTANAIAEVMDTSASTVSKLAKKAQEVGWLAVKNRKYHLVSSPPV